MSVRVLTLRKTEKGSNVIVKEVYKDGEGYEYHISVLRGSEVVDQALHEECLLAQGCPLNIHEAQMLRDLLIGVHQINP